MPHARWSLLYSLQNVQNATIFREDDLLRSSIMVAGWFIVVAALWGATNPFIKKGSKGVEKIKANSRFSQILAELKFLFLNWRYLVPFILNQAGSVVYYITLGSSDISLAVPITNSLTFVFTILSGRLLGEKINHWETYLGMVLVLSGVLLCVSDKF